MPYYRKKKDGFKKKAYVLMKTKEMPSKKPMKNFRGVANYKVKPEPFPRVLLTRMKFAWADTITTAAADVSVVNAFRMNSIYSPDLTSGNRTTVGHATMLTIYERYWVMGARVRISFNNAEHDGMRVGYRILLDNNTGAFGQSVRQLSEQPLTYMDGINDSGSQKKTFQAYIKPWSLMGVSKLEYLANSSTYSSSLGANPAAVNDCQIQVFMVHPTQAASSVRCNVQIVYDVKLYNRKSLVSSAI